MKLLRTIRFDVSDDFVFDVAAGPGEWAVSGAFAFADLDAGDLRGKTKQAFANGFLSLAGFGRSTFAAVAGISAHAHQELIETLAAHFCEAWGAPHMDAARAAAAEELDFISGLVADAPVNTVFTVRRIHGEDGAIREEFRTIAPPREALHTRIWDIVDDNDR